MTDDSSERDEPASSVGLDGTSHPSAPPSRVSQLNQHHIAEADGAGRLAPVVDDLDPVVERQMPLEHLGAGHVARAGEGHGLGRGDVGKLLPLPVKNDVVVVEIEIISRHAAAPTPRGGAVATINVSLSRSATKHRAQRRRRVTPPEQREEMRSVGQPAA